MNETKNGGPLIYSKIKGIIDELGAIGKDKTNVEQKFKYRGIDQFYNALHPLFAKYGVFSVPTTLERIEQPHLTKSGSAWRHVVVHMKYTFYAEDGSSFESTVYGEGLDSGDKSTNKAMSIAHKYCLLQVFCVATEDMEDPDEHTAPERIEGPEQASKSDIAKLTDLVTKNKPIIPDADLISLRKIYQTGCTKEIYLQWVDRIKQLEKENA